MVSHPCASPYCTAAAAAPAAVLLLLLLLLQAHAALVRGWRMRSRAYSAQRRCPQQGERDSDCGDGCSGCGAEAVVWDSFLHGVGRMMDSRQRQLCMAQVTNCWHAASCSSLASCITASCITVFSCSCCCCCCLQGGDDAHHAAGCWLRDR
jgi:hypothetical protein